MMRLFEAGDVAGALDHFEQAGKVGARFATASWSRSPASPRGG